MENLNNYIKLINLTLRMKRCDNLKSYFNISYSIWSRTISYIINNNNKLILRLIFDTMVKKCYFKKYKYMKSTFYIFDYFNKVDITKINNRLDYNMTF